LPLISLTCLHFFIQYGDLDKEDSLIEEYDEEYEEELEESSELSESVIESTSSTISAKPQVSQIKKPKVTSPVRRLQRRG
jgi:hypothetical protein